MSHVFVPRRTEPNSESDGESPRATPCPRLAGQNTTNPTRASPTKARKIAGQPNRSVITGPVAWPSAKPIGPLALKIPTAVARRVLSTARLTISIPAFHTMTYAIPPRTRDAIND